MMIEGSPFGKLAENRVLWKSDAAVAFLDSFPVSEGHTLLVPKRVVASLDELSTKEETALWAALREVRAVLQKQYCPPGFNIGINDGATAGQTIAHAHIHIIPRYEGDCSDPRGGVRWIFPKKARYW